MKHESNSSTGQAGYEPVEQIAGNAAGGMILLCDHATNIFPPGYGTLGMEDAQLVRHIAFDIGAAALTRELARRMGLPAVLSRFSRLLIDPNRGEDDPTLIMQLSDGAVVPGNARLDASERERRLALCYRPYHDAVEAAVDAGLATGRPPALLSIHSYTPVWRGTPRIWHAGILWDRDPRMALPMLEMLGLEKDLIVGDNEPYSGNLRGDTMWRHGTMRGLANALVEVRQDLIAEQNGVTAWADRLAPVIEALLMRPEVNTVRQHGSA
ncbi:MAG: N-formylglutamate amidohydrolase [Rhodobiaceae bacterium]|nr:N-formylglutamate amidohydrolase [Rhodobiaceae bacterium]MCC0057219.1 N-formylglutamate amidohydrolase [Rhodobiaceae bacterium]